jgi:NTP pyrophosphatase (non-canonical NTP hydrolase)
MNTEDIAARPPSPWIPERDPLTLAILGKLAEECGELSSRLARCIIQGTGANDPETGRSNVAHVADELADVFACMELAVEHLAVDEAEFDLRIMRKVDYLQAWHVMLRVEAVG